MIKLKEADPVYKESLKQLSFNVKYIRENKLKMSQEGFAHACGVTLKVISCLERRKGTNIYTLAKISAFTGWSISKLFG